MSSSSPAFLEYLLLIKRNRNYRLYLLSHICQDVGEWFVKVGAIATVQRLSKSYSGSNISNLMLTIMLPQLFMSPIGGAIADTFDRRRGMLLLDISSSAVVFGYLLALQNESIALLYLTSIIRNSLSSIYDPFTRSILPMIVNDDAHDLKRAVSLNYIAWSVMRIIGGVMAGYATANIGIEVCFLVDSATFVLSAIILWFIKGDFTAQTYTLARGEAERRREEDDSLNDMIQEEEEEEEEEDSAVMSSSSKRRLDSCGSRWEDLLYYLHSTKYGVYILLRASGAAIWGWADVLNVSYSHIGVNNEESSSEQLGILMSFLGMGTLIGPIFANYFTNPLFPISIFKVCLFGMCIMSFVGWTGILLFSESFYGICFFSSVRTFGAAILIANSTLLLQRVVKVEYLGRVLSLEFAISMGIDSLMNFSAGKFQDQGMNQNQIEIVAICIGIFLIVVWSCYGWIFATSNLRKLNKNIGEEQGDLLMNSNDEDDDNIEITPTTIFV